MNNKVKLAIISVTVASVSAFSVAPALAASYDANGQKIGFFDRVALMLGFKKDLSPEKKAARIESMKQKHEAKQSARLDALVSSGKITEAQKIELKAKLDAIEQAKMSSAGQTKQQRKEATEQVRNDLKSWAEANGLNLADLVPNKAQSPRHAQ